MIYEINLKNQPKKFLKKQQKHIQKRVSEWLKKLAKDPHTENEGIVVNQSIDNKQVYKKRIGNIRILFVIYEKEIKILIIEAQNRGQVYK